jgi:hydrogenase-1 operon protein HyaE
MTNSPPAVAARARSHPLIERLLTQPGCAEVDAPTLDAFARAPGHALLVFLEDPARYKETLDLAVIVPEITRVFAGRFAVGVLLPDAARAIHSRYGFRRWPALVVLKDGRYVGAVDGLRSWDEYLSEVARLLDAPPARAPGLAIPVHAEVATHAPTPHEQH